MRCKSLFHPFDYDFCHKHELRCTQTDTTNASIWMFPSARMSSSTVCSWGNNIKKRRSIKWHGKGRGNNNVLPCGCGKHRPIHVSHNISRNVHKYTKTPKWIHQCCKYEIVILQPNGRLMNDNKCVPCVLCTTTEHRTHTPISICLARSMIFAQKKWVGRRSILNLIYITNS